MTNSYILTVTTNPAVDRVIFIDEFRPGRTMRASQVVHSVGGKALDASVVLQTVGAPNLALSFMAGPTGQTLTDLLDNYGVPQDTVWVGGETRLANVIVETVHHRHSHVMIGRLEISPDNYADLLVRYQRHLASAGWVVTGGSLPPGVPADCYADLTEMANAAGVPLLIDAAGPAVPAMLRRCRPAILKMNRAELADTFGVCAEDMGSLIQCAGELRRREGLAALVLTCGADGILALTEEGCWLAAGPALQEVNAAGAGDAVSGVLPYRLWLGEPWPEALRRAAATSAAVVLTPGTADCRPDDIASILPQTRVERLGQQ